MLRKLALGLVAAAAVGIAAFAPTSASASPDGLNYNRGHHGHGMHHGHHGAGVHRGHHGFGMHRGGHGWHGAHAHMHNRGCVQQRLVPTPWGPRYRTVNVCRY
jgi:hypothetical protein